jgi:hypothetical protein
VAVDLTRTEQSFTSIGDAVNRDIAQALAVSNGTDKGIAIGTKCQFYDFETCEEIDLYNQIPSVRCMCVVYD